LTILLESDPAMSIRRARRRNRHSADRAHKGASKPTDENRFEQQSRSFFTRVRDGYMAIAAMIERLGAKLDGILRQHQRSADGAYRDTCVYSIIQPEWPTVRANLVHRLKPRS